MGSLLATVRWSLLVGATLWMCSCRTAPPPVVENPAPVHVNGNKPRLPKVVLLTTGGTIATRVDATTHKALPPLTGAELIAAAPGIKDVAQLEIQKVGEIGSADVTPEVWLDLLRRTREALTRDDVAAVVITHGTDTLEETAYFLDLTVASAKPLIMVGAQRMASDPDPDGPRNLLDAVKVAAAPSATGQGVLVVMNGQIDSARYVTKTSTVALDTFKSLEFGELGTVVGDRVQFVRRAPPRQTIEIDGHTKLPRVEIIPHYAGADGALISGILGPGLWPKPKVGGLVIAATGLGHVSASMYDEIKYAREHGIAVVIATRVQTGPTLARYPGKGLGMSLRDLGCIFVRSGLNPQKARILLMVALTQTKDSAALQRYFD